MGKKSRNWRDTGEAKREERRRGEKGKERFDLIAVLESQ